MESRDEGPKQVVLIMLCIESAAKSRLMKIQREGQALEQVGVEGALPPDGQGDHLIDPSHLILEKLRP